MIFIVLGAISAVVALLRAIPFDGTNKLDGYGVAGFAFLTVLFFAMAFRAEPTSSRPLPPATSEYIERFEAAQQVIERLTPEFDILGAWPFGPKKFEALNGDIAKTTADVVVSSDDNHFTARGGVAKAILDKAGPDVQRELERVRRFRFRQGQLALTTGGNWNCRALIHPAVIDLDENRYPNDVVIRNLTRRALDCASALGATSIAFPVLGGGTASKYIKPEESVRAIASESVAFLKDHHADENLSLTYIVLYIYNRADAQGLPPPNPPQNP